MREQTGTGAEDPRIAKGTKTNTGNAGGGRDIGLVYLGEIERGIKMPSLKTFIKLVNALDVSADELIGLETKSGRDYYTQKLSEQLQSLTQEEAAAVLSILETTIQQVKNLRNETV